MRRKSVRAAVVAWSSTVVLLTACGGKSEAELIASAREHLDKRETQAAIIQLKNALEKNASSGEARALLGRALLDDRDPAAAEIELRKALDAGARKENVLPALAQAMLQLGQGDRLLAQFGTETLQDPLAHAELKTAVAAAHAQRGDRDRAREMLAAALAVRPDHAPATLVQARLAAMDDDIDGAIRLVDGLLAKDPASEWAGQAKGDLLWFGKNDTSGALEVHRRVLAAHPKAAGSHSSVIAILFGSGQTAQAREQFTRMKAALPTHPETLFFEAQFAFLDQDLRRTRELTDLVLVAAVNHFKALELAAAAEYQLGNHVQAQAFADRALKVVPGLVLARQIQARSLLRIGQPARALQALQPLLSNANVDGATLALAGEVAMQNGDAQQAETFFQRATKAAPGDTRVRTAAALSRLGSGAAGAAALRELEQIATAAGDTRADLALISARIAQRDADGALKAIDALQPKMAHHPLPDQLRGQVLVAKRDADGARRAFEAALAKDAKYLPAVNALAAMDVAAGKPDAARKRLNDLLKLDPRNAQAMIALSAIAAHSGGAPDEVLRHLVDAVKADPTDPSVHSALIGHHLRAGDAASALTAAQRAGAALPNDAAVAELLGQVQIVAGSPQQAVSTFRRLTALQPDNQRLQLHLAEALLATQDGAQASRALRKALELDPQQGEARRALGMMALRDRRPAEALSTAREWQKHDPKDAGGFALEGDVEASRRNWVPAISAYQAALKLSDATEAAMKLHAAYRAAGRYADADRVAADWERRRAQDPAFQFYLGDVATNDKAYARAEQHYRNVLRSQPGNALAMNNIAWLLLQQSKPGALELAQRADALLPNRAPVLDTLAAAQAAAGRMADAVKTQKRALAASPQDPHLQLRLAGYLLKAGQKSEAREHLEVLARLGDRFSAQKEVAALQRLL
ncbi:MAG: PEP-CTERM system TPR-repeat protein PrsT [Rubrivivax sp.]|nr:PEP-CTERM system TPR-repeat protein PrsT [Rubrivivax sp.]